LDSSRRVQGLVPGAARERSLSWLDSSWAVDLSNDGRLVLLNEEDHNAIYLRKTDGSPAVPLGEGTALALSPGGDWVLARRTPLQLVLVPAGAGETRVLNTGGFQSIVAGSFLPDGKRVLLSGTETGHRPRLYLMDIQENKARPVSPEGVELFDMAVKCVSPDGKLAFAWSGDRGWLLYPLDGGDGASPLPIAGLDPENDAPVGWTADSQSLFVQNGNENPALVFRLNWKTGRRELFHEFRPADPTGIQRSVVLVTPDGKSWVYSYVCWLSQLYLVEGLK
jgi:dipeptidyl aminopeptidase/acylaminoacyl peptidase